MFGANYEHTRTWDSFLQTYGISTAVPTQVITATPLGPTNPNNLQRTDTYAAFGNIEYPVWDTITLQGGLRYTNQQRDYRGCGSDGGDGTWSHISQEIQIVLQSRQWLSRHRRGRRGSRQMREHRTGPDVRSDRERLRGQAEPGQRLVAYRNQLDSHQHDARLREREPGL